MVRTIYVSGGKPGWETRSGIKLIMAKEYNKKMTNEAIGAKEDYTLIARHALRITNSGEFLHSAPWNTAHFGRRNASHGCIGMSNGNAAWLYSNTLIGDPVITTGTSRGMEDGNGYSDWNISYDAVQEGLRALGRVADDRLPTRPPGPELASRAADRVGQLDRGRRCPRPT